jgi:rubrerythrin
MTKEYFKNVLSEAEQLKYLNKGIRWTCRVCTTTKDLNDKGICKICEKLGRKPRSITL